MAAEAILFHWADYLVFAIFLLTSALIGVYYGFSGKRQNSTEEFLMGDRKMGVLPVALSLQASFLSAVTVLGFPSITYSEGVLFSAWFAPAWIFVIIAVAHVYVPIFHGLRLTSAYEYLELRFNKPVRLVASALFVTMMLLYMSIALYGPSLSVSQVTGLPLWVAIVSSGLVCVFYTSLGGMKAVIWTDVFQMIIIIVGMLTLVVLGSDKVGGMADVWRIAREGGRAELLRIDADPTVRYTVWNVFAGVSCVNFIMYAANQATIQRYLTIQKMRHAQGSLYVMLPSNLLVTVLVSMLGLVVYAYYFDCDPLSSKRISRGDQIVVLLMMDILGKYNGLPGLFTASIFSASLSTLSSGLNSLAAVVVTDFISPIYSAKSKSPMSDKTATRVSKGLAIGFGLAVVLMAYLVQFLGNSIVQLASNVFSMVGGPLFGLITLGILFPWINNIGAIMGLVIGLLVSCWFTIGSIIMKHPFERLPVRVDGCPGNLTAPANISASTTPIMNYTTYADAQQNDSFQFTDTLRASWVWFAFFSTMSTMIAGILFSCLSGFHHKSGVDEDLVYDVCGRCCCCFSVTCRHKAKRCWHKTSKEGNYELKDKSQLAEDVKKGEINKTFDQTE